MPLNREIREVLAYILGGLGFLHELFIAQAERPFLLTASLALMGFPLVFRSEQKLSQGQSEDVEPTEGGEDKK